MLFKYGTIYREVMHTPKFNWCRLMDGLETNPMILQLRIALNDSFSDKGAYCPVKVQYKRLNFYNNFYDQDLQGIDIFNLTLKTDKLLSVFPTGDYQMHIFYYKKDKPEPDGYIKGIFSMLTSVKDTFG